MRMNDGDLHGGMRLSQFRPGHVFWLPKAATWLNPDKPRPFALVTTCGAAGNGTLVYGSTREAERRHGAACIEVPPQRAGLNRNGLLSKTWFYPGVLLRRAYEELPNHAGGLGRSLGDLRLALSVALGIGRGSCARKDAPAGSRRGRIVELRPDVVPYVGTRFAVLLTQPEYSRSKHYDVILPVRPGDGLAAAETVLRVHARDWFAVFGRPVNSVLLPIPTVQSLWYALGIARDTPYVVDEATLEQIDHALCGLFSLPRPDGWR